MAIILVGALALGGLIYYGFTLMAIEDYNCGYEQLYSKAKNGDLIKTQEGQTLGKVLKEDYRLLLITPEDTLSICKFASANYRSLEVVKQD